MALLLIQKCRRGLSWVFRGRWNFSRRECSGHYLTAGF
jgi:hypothetical protein